MRYVYLFSYIIYAEFPCWKGMCYFLRCVQTYIIGCCVAAYRSLCPPDVGCGDGHRSLFVIAMLVSWAICNWFAIVCSLFLWHIFLCFYMIWPCPTVIHWHCCVVRLPWFVIVSVQLWKKRRGAFTPPTGRPWSAGPHKASQCVCLFVRVFTFEVPLKCLFAPLLKVGCPKFLEILNPWGKQWKEVVSHMKKNY